MRWNRVAHALPALLLVAALLGAWELYVDLGGVEPSLLPAPHAVASALWENTGLLWKNFAITAREVVLGLGLALLSGFAMAVAIHLWQPVRRAVYPPAVGSQAVPIAVIAPLLVFWWGFGIFPKLIVIALICFFPVVVTTVDGLAAVDREQRKLLRTLDASRWQAFRFAELPGGAARGAQRRAHRGRGRCDRGLHRGVPDRDDRTVRRVGARDRQRRELPAGRRARGPRRRCCACSRSPASTP